MAFFLKIHCLSTVQGRSLAVLDAEVSGVIATAIAMQAAGAVVRFRDALAETVEKFIAVFPGSPPPSPLHPDVQTKLRLWDLLLPESVPKAAERRETLSFLLNGTIWQRLEHFGPVSPKEIATQVARALLPSAVPVFPRHRWVTSRQTFSEVALLATLVEGRVFAEAVQLWLGRVRQRPVESDHSSRGWDFAAIDFGTWSLPELGEGGEAEKRTEADDEWAARNRQAKADAVAWSQTLPGAALTVITCTMEPQVRLMAGFLFDASRAAEWSRLVQSSKGQPAHSPVAKAFSSDRTAKFLEDVRRLFLEEDPWRILQPRWRTRGFCSTAFAMISKSCCGVVDTIKRVQAGYPYRLFHLVVDPDIAHQIVSDAACLRDPFSNMFLIAFPTVAKLKSEESILSLAALCLLLRLDTARLECRHASIRRVKEMMSQTNAQALEQASAQFLLAQQRIIETRFGSHAAESSSGSMA